MWGLIAKLLFSHSHNYESLLCKAVAKRGLLVIPYTRDLNITFSWWIGLKQQVGGTEPKVVKVSFFF